MNSLGSFHIRNCLATLRPAASALALVAAFLTTPSCAQPPLEQFALLGAQKIVLIGSSGPGGPLSYSGPASISQSWGGASVLTALDYNITARSASTPEASGLFLMTSNTGAASGSGPLSAFKIALGTQMTMNAGSGNGYALNSILTVNSGVGTQFGDALESDLNNFNKDYPLPNQVGYLGVTLSGHNISTGSSTFPGSAAIYMGTLSPTTYAWHAGLYMYGSNLIEDYSVFDATNSTNTFYDMGVHTVGINLSNASYTGNQIQGTNFAIGPAGAAAFANVLIVGGAQHAASLWTASNFLEIQAGSSGIAFPNSANSENLLLLQNSSFTLGTGVVLGLPQVSWADNQSCTAGQIDVDASFIYVCTATNVVKRATLLSF